MIFLQQTFAFLLVLLCAWSLTVVQARVGLLQDDDGSAVDGITTPTTLLHGGQSLPLIGYGVGNLQHELIESHVSTSMGQDFGYRLFDTAHASRNEHLLAHGIQLHKSSVLGKNSSISLYGGSNNHSTGLDVHVVTKVWYTHLGYERTLISVRESFEQLANGQGKNDRTTMGRKCRIHVHMLLHWPRCRDDIPWMRCAEEEDSLPQHVRDAGPPPHLTKDTSYLESWRALEDIYLGHVQIIHADGQPNFPTLASIGVSNFAKPDLEALAMTARVTPHILQDNVWTLLFDPHLIQYCRQHDIHYQAYNVMNGILNQANRAPNAFDSLREVASGMSKAYRQSSDDRQSVTMSVSQLILKWLTQQGVSTIPRTTSISHMEENSPLVVTPLPSLDEHLLERVRAAVSALLTGRDLKRPTVTFVNQHNDTTMHIFWSSGDGETDEVHVKEHLAPGESFSTDSTRGHVFVAYDAATRLLRREFTVEASYDERQEIHIDEL